VQTVAGVGGHAGPACVHGNWCVGHCGPLCVHTVTGCPAAPICAFVWQPPKKVQSPLGCVGHCWPNCVQTVAGVGGHAGPACVHGNWCVGHCGPLCVQAVTGPAAPICALVGQPPKNVQSPLGCVWHPPNCEQATKSDAGQPTCDTGTGRGAANAWPALACAPQAMSTDVQGAALGHAGPAFVGHCGSNIVHSNPNEGHCGPAWVQLQCVQFSCGV